MASENTYRTTAHRLKEWMVVDISYSTVGTIIQQVGEEIVNYLEGAAELPKGKEVDYYAGAVGVFVRKTAWS